LNPVTVKNYTINKMNSAQTYSEKKKKRGGGYHYM